MAHTPFLDTRTVLVVSIMLASILGLLLLVFARLQRDMRALSIWGWTALVYAAGIAILSLRGHRLEALNVAVGNGLLFLGGALMLRSLRSFHGRAPGDRIGWAIVIGGILLLAFWSAIVPSVPRRIVVFSVVYGLLTGRVALFLLRTRSTGDPWPQRVAASALGILSLTSFARGGLTLAADPSTDFLAPSNVQSISLLLNLGLYLVATLGVLWMEIQRLKERLVNIATTDPLTGIANRRAFFEAHQRGLRARRGDGEPLAACVMDLDHFKSINDRYGHAAGDAVLREFASAVSACVPPGVTFARLGGEEFGLLCPRTDLASAVAIAECCREAASRLQFEFDGAAVRVTMSAGVAVTDAPAPDLDALLAEADAALYQSKREGRNRVTAAPGGEIPALHAVA